MNSGLKQLSCRPNSKRFWELIRHKNQYHMKDRPITWQLVCPAIVFCVLLMIIVQACFYAGKTSLHKEKYPGNLSWIYFPSFQDANPHQFNTDHIFFAVMINTDETSPGIEKSCKEVDGNCTVSASKCGRSHGRSHLICKTAHSFEQYYKVQEKFSWLCLVDDDTYVVIPNLLKLFSNFDPRKDWYIGKITMPPAFNCNGVPVHFLHGALLCFSRHLAERMKPYVAKNKFSQLSSQRGCPDDLILGYIAVNLLGVNRTGVPEMRSHYENLHVLNSSTLKNQVALSYKISAKNFIEIRNEFPHFSDKYDPTRYKSFHCYMFPKSESCKKLMKQSPLIPVKASVKT